MFIRQHWSNPFSHRGKAFVSKPRFRVPDPVFLADSQSVEHG